MLFKSTEIVNSVFEWIVFSFFLSELIVNRILIVFLIKLSINRNNNNNNNNNNKRKETNPSTFSSIYMKKNNKWSKRRKDRMLIRFIFAPFLLWISNIFFDLAIIVSNKKIVLILELRTLMEGQYLFCLQEYRYCFASKNTMIPKYLVLTSNTKQYVFVWRFSILTLWTTSHFMTS